MEPETSTEGEAKIFSKFRTNKTISQAWWKKVNHKQEEKQVQNCNKYTREAGYWRNTSQKYFFPKP